MFTVLSILIGILVAAYGHRNHSSTNILEFCCIVLIWPIVLTILMIAHTNEKHDTTTIDYIFGEGKNN